MPLLNFSWNKSKRLQFITFQFSWWHPNMFTNSVFPIRYVKVLVCKIYAHVEPWFCIYIIRVFYVILKCLRKHYVVCVPSLGSIRWHKQMIRISTIIDTTGYAWVHSFYGFANEKHCENSLSAIGKSLNLLTATTKTLIPSVPSSKNLNPSIAIFVEFDCDGRCLPFPPPRAPCGHQS